MAAKGIRASRGSPGEERFGITGGHGGRGGHGGPGQVQKFPTWTWAIIITIVLAAFGAIYSLGQDVGTINDKLDRNCRILVTLDQDIRLQSLVMTPNGTRRKTFAPFPDVSC